MEPRETVEPEEDFESYLRRRLAEMLVEAGVPWQLVHCPFCGAPGPSIDHECDPNRPVTELRGIFAAAPIKVYDSDLPRMRSTSAPTGLSYDWARARLLRDTIKRADLLALDAKVAEDRWTNPEIVTPLEAARRRRELERIAEEERGWKVRLVSETTWVMRDGELVVAEHHDYES